MKMNSANDSNKMCFLFFNENKSPNLGKHCKTKTRNEVKDNFLNFDFNNCHQGSPFHNGLRTKQKQLNYLNLNQSDNNNLPLNNEQNNFGSFLNKLQNSNRLKNGPNINIIVFSPNYDINKRKSENKNENINLVNNNSLNEQNKEESNVMFNFNYYQEEKKGEKEKMDSPIKNNNRKSLFDSNFNLIEENCGQDDVSEILKEFANLNLKSSVKEKSNCFNNNPKININSGASVNNFMDSSKDKEKKYTNTGDSVNTYNNNGNESEKKEKRFYNIPNPYAKAVYKK